MKVGGKVAFVALAFVIGATISQASFAFADDSTTNPFRAVWQAISELQTKTDSLQAQINDLKSQQASSGPSALQQIPERISDLSVATEIGAGQSGQTLIQTTVKNAGPENAVGVKLSVYYQPSLFQVNYITGEECTDGGRGIVQCYLGTLDSATDKTITIDATPLSLNQQASIIADISSITTDPNLTNNHSELTFVTSATPAVVVIVPSQPQPQQEPPAGGASQLATEITTASTSNSTASEPGNVPPSSNSTQNSQNELAAPASNSTSTNSNESTPATNSTESQGANSSTSTSSSDGSAQSPSTAEAGASNSESSTSTNGQNSSSGTKGGSTQSSSSSGGEQQPTSGEGSSTSTG